VDEPDAEIDDAYG
jgi:hypothetical protein